MKNKNNQEGFITTIILVIVALIALKYLLNFDVIAYIKSPGPQKTIQMVWGYAKAIYTWIHDTILRLLGK